MTPAKNTGKNEPAAVSAAAVAALAGEVEALRRRVEELTGVDARVEEVAGLVARLAQSLTERSPRRPKVGNRTWLDLPTDHREAAALLEELTTWLGVVFLRYTDGEQALPECWLWHPDVVEELVWLMEAWKAAYANPEAPVSMAGDWHDRQRPGVVRRIRIGAGSCSLDKHQAGLPLADPPATRLRVTPRRSIVAWWSSHRGEAPPEPDEHRVARAKERRRATKARRHEPRPEQNARSERNGGALR